MGVFNFTIEGNEEAYILRTKQKGGKKAGRAVCGYVHTNAGACRGGKRDKEEGA